MYNTGPVLRVGNCLPGAHVYAVTCAANTCPRAPAWRALIYSNTLKHPHVQRSAEQLWTERQSHTP